mmetsp:Transcript_17559/g.27537  ORF Transcript_17559/g.27537 Transcript_17559/m.27537 type:complete len:902 (-) Transcript_17559:1179-3884(-)|eukprot:CAMPEP_0201728244 /NCGR_PEP_ID=MMETSP0593-20130828/15284_1 /ASSEMBLY_ACC=CAM_ASM_000672 /TAXON_ID=267983 /ORGANISM="Skeletonema japonicum, Strain CCMP2506" /LENGTH=901 /DNA_ID=CAMNT_0048220295 /DNA_START=15 /DNA_END=2720 /DNA_ORIENTATION=+
MPPRRRARGRAAAAPTAEESSDSEPEQQQQQQPRQPDTDNEEEEDEPQNNTNNTADDDNASESSHQHHHQNTTTTPNDNHPDQNTLRILLSTDNHLGYLEKDPIRGNDSFAALEEVLSLARLHRVDLVLLSGDLFHDNKPSRRTLHATMEILRRYCMGGEAVKVQIVSDQKECLRSVVSGRANYEDEFYSVDLPIFTIHGNHDDPTRDGSSELLSPIDLLSVSNLLNYFGRQDAVDNVQVSPILLQKGGTKVALYGMGSMRDERLNRMWQGKKVRFLRPEMDIVGAGGRNTNRDEEEEEEDEESRDWFNIFTLHQNRDLGRGSKNCVHESMIPEWMDLVVWGHEHECNIEPAESLVGTFRVTQPGSSVATSLTAGEARRKQIGILDVRGQQFRLSPVPLSSVRAFAVGEVNLGDVARSHGGGVLDVEDPKVEERMGDVLAGEVEALIQKARDEAEQLRQDAEAAVQASMALEDEFDPDKRQRKYTIKNPEQVLVRLKVEHSGFTTLNNQRFGSRFVGEVANPSDILLFHKRRSAETAKRGASKKSSLNIPTEPDDLDETNIEDLITDNLEKSDKKLELLDEKTMGEALNAFVDKEERRAIDDAAEKILKENRKLIKSRQNGEEEETSELNANLIREMCSNRTQAKNAAYLDERETQTTTKKKKKNSAGEAEASAKKRSDDHDSLSDDSDDIPPPKKSRTTTAKKPAKSRKKADLSDDDFSEEDVPKPAKKRAPAKAATSRKKKRQDYSDSDDEIQFMGTQSSKAPARAKTSRARSTAKKPKYNYDDDDDDDDFVDEPPATKSKGRATASRARSTAKKSKYNYDDDDDEIMDDDDFVVEETPVEKPRGRGATKSKAKTASKPAGRGRAGRVNLYNDSDSDDYDQPQTGGGWGVANSQASRRR